MTELLLLLGVLSVWELTWVIAEDAQTVDGNYKRPALSISNYLKRRLKR